MHPPTYDTPLWLITPFCLLLFMIATGPVLYERFWHKNYATISIVLSVLVGGYYTFIIKDLGPPVHALMEYVQFVSFIGALYIAVGGIYIDIKSRPTPLLNLSILFLGAIFSNIIGTTGASMLFIRPYIRINTNNIKMYHIVFFIFIVSNIGGCMTPIGDPPLFLGFLSGVPFFWMLKHGFLSWITAISVLGCIFYFLEVKNYKTIHPEQSGQKERGFQIQGAKNFFWVLAIIASVFLDTSIFKGLPTLQISGHSFSFLREVLLVSIAYLSYKSSCPSVLKKNQFEFGPIKEVAILFVGIFFTMVPALHIIKGFASSETGKSLITTDTLYWVTGGISSLLDNAPTYMNFLAASMGTCDMDIYNAEHVKNFASGSTNLDTISQLRAISISSVFFGAMTYIGNGPNLMIKSIAQKYGIRTPSFFSYISKYSLVYLLPVLVLIWALYI